MNRVHSITTEEHYYRPFKDFLLPRVAEGKIELYRLRWITRFIGIGPRRGPKGGNKTYASVNGSDLFKLTSGSGRRKLRIGISDNAEAQKLCLKSNRKFYSGRILLTAGVLTMASALIYQGPNNQLRLVLVSVSIGMIGGSIPLISISKKQLMSSVSQYNGWEEDID